jgi:hypothetical protein
MSQTQVEQERLAASIAAIKVGDVEQARAWLRLAIADNPENDRAWQWLSVVAESAEEQRRCLYRALSINPNSETVQEALRQMEGQDKELVSERMPVSERMLVSEQMPVPAQNVSVAVPAVFQPIVYYDRPSTHKLSSYIMATALFCVTALGFMLVILGSLLPWATLAGASTAPEQEGYFTFITGVVGILVAMVGIWRSGCLSLLASIAAISFALVSVAVSAYHYFGMSGPDVVPGWGFVFILLGGIIAMLSSVVNSFSGLKMLSFAMRE